MLEIQKRRLHYLFLATLSVLLYLPSLFGKYYGDDFTLFFPKGTANPLHLFFGKNPFEMTVYRPLEESYNAFIQSIFGLNPIPVHIAHIVVFALTVCLIYKVMNELSCTPLQSIIGSVFFAISQACVFPVAKLCTLSQMLSCFFSFLCLFLLYKAYNSKINFKKYYLYSVIVFFIALISKETSLSLLVSCMLLIFIYEYINHKKWINKEFFIRVFPHFALVIFYFIIRISIGLPNSVSKGGRTISLGFGSVKNAFSLLLSDIIPFSSARFFEMVERKQLIPLVLVFSLTLLFVAIVSIGLYKSERNKLVFMNIAFIILSLFPAVLMVHVSELYSYNAMPFFAILIGIGLGALINLFKDKKSSLTVVYAIILVVAVMNAGSVIDKTRMMVDNGKTMEKLIGQVTPILKDLPSASKVVFVNPETKKVKYSAYMMYNFSLFHTANFNSLRYVLGRPDIQMVIIDAKDIEKYSDSSYVKITIKNDIPVIMK